MLLHLQVRADDWLRFLAFDGSGGVRDHFVESVFAGLDPNLGQLCLALGVAVCAFDRHLLVDSFVRQYFVLVSVLLLEVARFPTLALPGLLDASRELSCVNAVGLVAL